MDLTAGVVTGGIAAVLAFDAWLEHARRRTITGVVQDNRWVTAPFITLCCLHFLNVLGPVDPFNLVSRWL